MFKDGKVPRELFHLRRKETSDVSSPPVLGFYLIGRLVTSPFSLSTSPGAQDDQFKTKHRRDDRSFFPKDVKNKKRKRDLFLHFFFTFWFSG